LSRDAAYNYPLPASEEKKANPQSGTLGFCSAQKPKLKKPKEPDS